MSLATNPPLYDSSLDPPNCQLGVAPDTTRLKAFVQALVARYGDRVKYFGVGNETANPVFWRGGNVYEKLFIPAYDAAKAEALARGYAVQVVGPDTDLPADLEDGLRAERLYGRRMWDVISIHTYGFGLAAFLPVLAPYRDLNGPRPVWVTEAGAEVSDPSTEAMQTLTLRGIYLTMADAMSRGEVEKFFLYRLKGGVEPWQVELEGRSAGEQRDHGILHATGRPRPAYEAVKKLLCPADDCGTWGLRGVDLAASNAWYFAEGYTGAMGFETEYALYNDEAKAAVVDVVFLDETGRATVFELALPAWSQRLVRLSAQRPPGAYSAVLVPRDGAPIFASRSMTWAGRRGAHASAGVTRLSTRWYFAEGSRRGEFFENYYTVANPNPSAASVTLRAFRSDGVVAEEAFTVPAFGRLTVSATAGSLAQALAGADFSVELTASSPVTAERSMYWNSFGAGTTSTGIDQPASEVYFAEGVELNGWSTFLLFFNPGSVAVSGTITFGFDNGAAPVSRAFTVGPKSRSTVHAGSVGVSGSFSAQVKATGPLVAERAVYMAGFVEGHVSQGAAATAPRWFLPDAMGYRGHQAYVLVANPNPQPVTAVLTSIATDGTAVTSSIAVAANSRTTVWMGAQPTLAGKRFATTVKVGSGPGIVVEGTNYWNAFRTGTGLAAIPRP